MPRSITLNKLSMMKLYTRFDEMPSSFKSWMWDWTGFGRGIHFFVCLMVTACKGFIGHLKSVGRFWFIPDLTAVTETALFRLIRKKNPPENWSHINTRNEFVSTISQCNVDKRRSNISTVLLSYALILSGALSGPISFTNL